MSKRGYSCVALHQPKNPLNVGSVLRAAHCYEASAVFISGRRYMQKNIPTDTPKTWKHTPVICGSDLRGLVPFDCVPVAVDLLDGARDLREYVHPERATYIFGPEDGTLGISVLEWCRDVVYVPTRDCMNLAATVNVVLYDRLSKMNKS